MAKLTKIAYFGYLRGTIDFENLLLLEKTAKKPSTRTKHAVKNFLWGLTISRGVSFLQNFHKLGDSNKLKSYDKNETFVNWPPTIRQGRVRKIKEMSQNTP